MQLQRMHYMVQLKQPLHADWFSYNICWKVNPVRGSNVLIQGNLLCQKSKSSNLSRLSSTMQNVIGPIRISH